MKQVPPDYAIRYQYYSEPTPPPDHYQYTIQIGPSSGGEIVFCPDYHEELHWTETFNVEIDDPLDGDEDFHDEPATGRGGRGCARNRLITRKGLLVTEDCRIICCPSLISQVHTKGNIWLGQDACPGPWIFRRRRFRHWRCDCTFSIGGWCSSPGM